MNADRIDRRTQRTGSRDFSPINVGKVLPPPAHFCPALLDAPRALPDYEAQDDMGAYSETLPPLRHREALEGMLVVECPEASHG